MSFESGGKYVDDGYVENGYTVVNTANYNLSYTMYGKPARVFPFAPNWAAPVTEAIEWKTQILRSRDGSEQRRQLRVIPRRSFDYQIMVHGDHAGYFEALLWGWQHRHFALPVWTERGNLSVNANTGVTTLMLDTSGLGFDPSGYAIIYAGPKNYEVVELNGVLADRITLTTATSYDWAEGTRVYPLILGHMQTSVQTTRYTSSALEAAISFQCVGDDTVPNLGAVAPLAMYDGYEVITHHPNWRSTISNEFTRAFDIVDTGVGPVGYYSTETISRIIRPISWFLKTRSDMMQFRSIMGRLCGQAKTCWVPSWHDDFEIAGSNSADQSTLIVRGTWFASFVGADTSRNRVMVRLPSGNVVYRRIQNIAPNFVNDTSVLRLDSTLGTTVSVGDNCRVRFLMRCRLATDRVVIPWRTDRFAEPQTTFTTVKL